MKTVSIAMSACLGLTMLASACLIEPKPANAGDKATGPCVGCNVVWVTLDTTRADRMGFLGNKNGLTPNLDRHARAAAVFARAYSQAPETLQSVSAFFSGRYRANNGMDFDLGETARWHALSPEVTTVAEAYQAAGYQTVGFNANAVIARNKGFAFNLDQGFDRWEFGEDDTTAAAATAWLGASTDQPFFLYVQLMGPHADNEKLPGFDARRGPQTTTLGKATQPWYQEVNGGKVVATDGDIAFVRALYDDAVWRADQQIGAIFDAARAARRGGRTILVFASDHGEILADTGGKRQHFGHGNMLNEVLLHVPLFIASPGVSASVDTTHVAELVDVAPTLAALTGLSVKSEWAWDGKPLLGSSAQYGDTAIAERSTWDNRQVAIRTLAEAVTYTPPKGWKNAYDVARDPMHGTPVKPWTAGQTALFTRLEAYLADAHPPATGEKTAATPEELEMLKALGYTQ